MEIVQIITYAFGLIFLIGFLSKTLHYARMPIHLRWELYPLAGERRRPWGGSYLEEPEWWAIPDRANRSLAGELAFTAQEVLFFRGYFEHNRSLWRIIYPFHMAIFCFVLFFLLLVVGAIGLSAEIAIGGRGAGTGGQLIYYATLASGIAALTVGTIGNAALFLYKIMDGRRRMYARRIELLNILLALAVFATGLCAWAIADPTFADAREFVRSLFTFGETPRMEAISLAHVLLLGIFLAYLPFTNMMHAFAKFFTYHRVRWDAAPQLRGSRLERSIETLIRQPVTWSAPHVQGIQRWTDTAGRKES